MAKMVILICNIGHLATVPAAKVGHGIFKGGIIAHAERVDEAPATLSQIEELVKTNKLLAIKKSTATHPSPLADNLAIAAAALYQAIFQLSRVLLFPFSKFRINALPLLCYWLNSSFLSKQTVSAQPAWAAVRLEFRQKPSRGSALLRNLENGNK